MRPSAKIDRKMCDPRTAEPTSVGDSPAGETRGKHFLFLVLFLSCEKEKKNASPDEVETN